MKYKEIVAKPYVDVEIVVGWEHALEAARFTQGKPCLYDEDGNMAQPSDRFKYDSLIGEHSQIKVVQYKIFIHDLAQWNGVHLLRHGYTLPYINSQRNDRNESVEDLVKRIFGELLDMIKEEEPNYNPRNLLPQGTGNEHLFWMNAQTIINISKKRICRCASKETREVWRLVLEALNEVDPILVRCCVPTCVYRGWCTEKVSCGYSLTSAYQEQVKEYRNLIKPTRERMK